jgi:hypothetical protein
LNYKSKEHKKLLQLQKVIVILSKLENGKKKTGDVDFYILKPPGDCQKLQTVFECVTGFARIRTIFIWPCDKIIFGNKLLRILSRPGIIFQYARRA